MHEAKSDKNIRRKLKVSRRYDSWSRFYDGVDNFPLISRPQKVWRKRAVDLLLEDGARDVLDVGSGTGYILPLIADGMDSGSITALDISRKMLRRSIERMDVVAKGHRRGVWVHHILGDSNRMPFKSGTFDGVIGTYAYTSIPQYREALEESVRVLKLGGRLVILDTGPPIKAYVRPFHRALTSVSKVFGYTYMDRDIIGYLDTLKGVRKVKEERYYGTMVYLVVHKKIGSGEM